MKNFFLAILLVAFLISCVSAPVISDTKPSYGNEAPIDPYDMQEQWVLPGAQYCGYYRIDELDGSIVFACILLNPDESAEWESGVISREIGEDGELTERILMFAIINNKGTAKTYIFKDGNYIHLDTRNTNFERDDAA